MEQEEKELEMRWRATKRVSENWLTKVELMRQRHRARLEKLGRERQMKKKKTGGGTSGSMAVKETITSQGNPRTTTTSQLHSSKVPPPAPPAVTPRSNVAFSQLPPTAWHLSSSASRSMNDSASIQVPGSRKIPPSALIPGPATNPKSSRGAVSRGHAPSTNPTLPHAPYDPRTPDLALEDLAHVSLDSTQLSPLILPERFLDIEVPAGVGNLALEESILTQQRMMQDHVHPYIDKSEEAKWLDCVQQYFDVAKMQMSPSPVMHPSASSSQDVMPLISLPPSTHTTLPTATPDIAEDGSEYLIQQPPLSQALQDGLLPPSTASRSPRSLAFDRWLLNNIYDMGPSEFQAGPVPPMDDQLPDGQYAGTASNPYPSVDTTATQELSNITSGQNMALAEPSAEEKAMWHAWSLSQAPPDTAAEIIMRNIQASSASIVVPTGVNPIPRFAGNNDDVARLKMLVGFSPAPEQQVRMVTDWAWSWVPYTTVPLNEANASLMMAPRAVLVDPTYSTIYSPLYSPTHRIVNNEAISQDQSVAPVPLSIPVSRPAPVLKTHDLPSSLRSSYSHVDSPISPSSPHTATTALFTESGESSSSPLAQHPLCLTLGDRLFRIARVANADVLRPSYWFEPDIMVTERMRNVVDLLEGSGGWVSGILCGVMMFAVRSDGWTDILCHALKKCSERRMRMFDGVRTPRGPDDLAALWT